MQKITLYISLLLYSLSLAGMGTPPERILPLTQSIYPIEYYQEQMLIWENHLQTQAEDPVAWMNYYTAARNINILSGTQINQLGDIADNSLQQIPTTFEAHYIQYWQSGLFDRKYEELLQAHELAPDRWEVYHDLLHYYEIKGDQQSLATYAERLFKSGHLSAGILDWNYNALMSVSKNGILLTQGDNDTYPAWVLQQVKNIRADVNVINLYLLLAEDAYRERVFDELNIESPFPRQISQSTDNQLKGLVNHLFTYSSRPLFLGVATPSDLRKELSNDLYLTGLAFQHSDRQIDNLAILDYNYQKQFRTESLSESLVYDPAQSVINHMNMNYIPSFALLYRYYIDNNRATEAEQTKTLMTEIATRASKLEEVGVIFNDHTNEEKSTDIAIDLRDFDKQLMLLSNRFYASATEVSNAEYNAFLENLLDQRQYDLLSKCEIHPTDWRSFLPRGLEDMSELSMFTQGHPNDDESPIINISHEAALLYCEWLTEVYNQSEHRKKRFKKVRFRLPTAEEWSKAAKANKEQSVYPWGGPYFRNAKGCLLANFDPSSNVISEKEDYIMGTDNKNSKTTSTEDTAFNPVHFLADDDGAFFTVNVESYFPNNLGLYNMAGNVAEMLDKKDVTMGGGWNDPSYYMQTDVQNEVVLPSPNVGFRVFMDVLE